MEIKLINQLFDEELAMYPLVNPSLSELDEEMFEELFDGISEDATEELSGYLQRAKQILSLAREKKRQSAHRPAASDFFKIFKGNIKEKRKRSLNCLTSYLLQEVAKKIVRPQLLELADIIRNNPSEASYGQVMDGLRKLLMEEDLELGFGLTELERAVIYSFTKMDMSSSVSVSMISKSGDRTCLTLNGAIPPKKRDRVRVWKNKKKRVQDNEKAKATDFNGLAEGVLYRTLDQIFQARCMELSKEEKNEDVVYRCMWERARKHMASCMTEDGILLISEYAADVQFLELLNEHGMKYMIIPAVGITNEMRVLRRHCLAELAPFLTSLPRFWYSYASEDSEDSMYRWTLQDTYTELFCLLFEECRYTAEKERFQNEVKHTARVFQTKKNIPEKCIKVMEASVLNDTFGYVELDEECDLMLFKEIEKEFTALKTLCFGAEQSYKNVAIRFRKLGRHRAAGLYFPTLHCLCVDIHSPSSLCHEYLHMFDHESGELSEKYSFMEIRMKYEDILREAIKKMPEEDDTKKHLLGKSQYNLQYYLQPTEIFARCGEMYFSCIHQIHNSLLVPKYGFAYPKENEELMKMIDIYYTKLFPAVAGLELKGGQSDNL